MLKTVDRCNLFNSKCGEIFCQGSMNFSITCSLCDSITLEFNDFIEHFTNLHRNLIDALLEVEHELPITSSKRESPTLLKDVERMETEEAAESCCLSQDIAVAVNDNLVKDNQLIATIDREHEECNISLAKTKGDVEQKDQDDSNCLKRQKGIRKNCRTKTKLNKVVTENSSDRKPHRHQNDQLKCPMCGIYKNNKYNLQSHINSHTGARPYNCQKCGNNFTNSGNLWKHIELVHKGIRTHECIECKKKFQYKSQVKRHEMRVHLKVRPFPCDLCDSSYCTKKELTEHQHKHLQTEADTALEGDAFESTLAIQQDQQQGYVCEHCGKSFAKYSGIWAHRRLHSKEKRYVCNVCNKPMHTAYHLKEHMNTHTGERPHKCEVCGKAFQQKKFLRDHSRIHAEVKAFACKLCDKKFSQAAGLYCHSKTHKEI